VRAFIERVRATVEASASPADSCERLKPAFAELLADAEWLPPAYQEPTADSGMGGGIG